jgi:hypothetical protein
MSDNNTPQTLDGRPAEPLPEGWGRPASTGQRAGRWEGSGRNTPVTLGSLVSLLKEYDTARVELAGLELVKQEL